MAKRLTEEMVIARTKISDLSKIKRLNCWGTELVDVSLLRKMPAVEVLSLSINKISTLIDFQYCKRLEELYIRQNNIHNLNEVVYLTELANLKNLWLGENPCANLDGYRLAIIRALPQLQKLDNIQITPDEVREAQKKGRTLFHPDDEVESEAENEDEDEVVEVEYTVPRPNTYYSEEEYSSPPVQRSPPRHENEFDVDESEEFYPKDGVTDDTSSPPTQSQSSPPIRRHLDGRRGYSPDAIYVERRRNSCESPKQYYDKNHLYENNSTTNITSTTNKQMMATTCDLLTNRETKIVTSQSMNCIKEYTNGDKYVQSQHRHNELTNEMTTSNIGHAKERERYTCPAASHKPPFQRRPVTRNSNILSAVLCLVKELDYPSLEVVEMAVRCRMDELDE